MVEPIKITFRDGDKEVDIEVPFLPIQMWQQLPNTSWFGIITELIRAAMQGLEKPPRNES